MASNNKKGPFIPDLATYVQAGLDPHTKGPAKLSMGRRSNTKQDIKIGLRKHDLQIAANRYKWTGLPKNISSQELEKWLYYYGELAFWYCPQLDQFFFSKFALDGGLDFYGRYNSIHPIPLNGGGTEDKSIKAQEAVLSDYKLNVQYGIYEPEEMMLEDGTIVERYPKDVLLNSAVLLSDYTKQFSKQVMPTVMINESVIDLEAECMPFLRTALLNSTGTRGVVVPEGADPSEVAKVGSALADAAINTEMYLPINGLGNIDFQELTNGTSGKSQEFLQAMQAIDNYRLGLHGIANGGLYDKSQYVNNTQTNMNLGGADVTLTLQDGLNIRERFCDIVNSIWGLGINCEISENLVNVDLNGDGVAYDRNVEDTEGVEE